jgi:hypothetical protein
VSLPVSDFNAVIHNGVSPLTVTFIDLSTVSCNSITTLTDDTMTDSSGAWVEDALIGKYIHVISGTNAGEWYQIADNGTDWIQISRTFVDGIVNGDFSAGLDNWTTCQSSWDASSGVMHNKLYWGVVSQSSIMHVCPTGGGTVTFKYRWKDNLGVGHHVYLDKGNCATRAEIDRVSGSGGAQNPSWPEYDTHSFSAPNGTNFIIQTLDTNFYRDVDFYFKEFSSNRVYDTLVVMGFSTTNKFEVVDNIGDDNYTITDWLWDFGDGETSTDQNPIHIYDTLGTYTPTLTVTNGAGSGQESKTDYVSVIVSGAPSLCLNSRFLGLGISTVASTPWGP